MRELILLPTMAILCVLALVQPYIGMCAYIWYGVMRPDILAFVENKYPFSLVIAIVAGLSTFVHNISFIDSRLLRNPLAGMLFLMQIPIGLSVVFAVNTDLCFPRYSFYIRMIAVILLVPLAILTFDHLKLVIFTLAVSVGVIGVKFGLYGVIHGGVELARGYSDMLPDNNFVALALATNIPLLWYCRRLTKNLVFKVLLMFMLGCSMAGIVMSNSRGGVVAMAVAALLIVLWTKQKVLSLMLLVLMAAGSIYLVQDMFVNRMSTLAEYNEEASAASRLQHAGVALRMWKDHPAFGVGFGGINYGTLVTRYMGNVETGLSNHVVHNSYLQVLVDSGPLAFILYVGMFAYSIRCLGKQARAFKNDLSPYGKEAGAVSRGLQLSLITYCVGSTFYSANRIDIPYILVMIASTWLAIRKEQLAGVALPPVYQAPVVRAPAPERAPA